MNNYVSDFWFLQLNGSAYLSDLHRIKVPISAKWQKIVYYINLKENNIWEVSE